MLSDRDPAISPVPSAGWESHVDDLTVELIENCGHFTPEEAPELVVERALALFSD
jgi:pimeloyl-ACP methyl ester carboxylesterase